MKTASSKGNQQYTKLYVNKNLLALITIIVLVTPMIITGSFDYFGKDPYLLERLGNNFLDSGLENYDDLSYSGRIYSYPIGTVIFTSLFLWILGGSWAIEMIPILLGVLSSLLLYQILEYLKFNKRIILISTLIFIISPPFIFTFTYLNYFTFPVFLSMLSLYLFIVKKQNFVPYIILILLPLFGVEHAIISLLILLLIKKIKQKETLILIFLILISTLLSNLLPIANQGIPELLQFKNYNPLFQIFSDFGSHFGISLFLIFLSVFGFKHLWIEKYKHKKIYAATASLIVLLIINPRYAIYINILLVPLSGIGISHLLKSKWESNLIKELTLIILVLGLIFSSTAFINNYKTPEPSQDVIAGLNYIKDNSNENEVIFSHIKNGIWINAIAKRPNVMDEMTFYAPQVNQRYNDSLIIFNSRNIGITRELLNKYNITYIFITPDMKKGVVWTESEQGLLFLLKYNNHFERIYVNNGIEIWRYKND